MDDERLATLEHKLLRAVAAEVAPPGVRRRALSALRLLALMPTAKRRASADSWPTIGRPRNPLLSPLLRWLLVVLAGAALGAIGAALAPRLRTAAAALSNRASASHVLWQNCNEVKPDENASSQTSSSPFPVETGVHDELETLRAVEASRSSGLSAPPSPGSDSSDGIFPAGASGSVHSLRLEIVLLDRAHEALRRADAERALTILDDYSALFPDGELLEEAAVMREQGLSASAAAAR